MQIFDAFTKSYGPVLRYVQHMLPIMPRYVPSRYKAYKKCCASDTLADEGISWCKGPQLIIDNIEALRGHVAAGMFSQDVDCDAIFFDITCADKYAANPQKYAVAIQYTLLHELIHWARFHVSASSRIAGQEAGSAFELEAYGQDVSYLWGGRIR